MATAKKDTRNPNRFGPNRDQPFSRTKQVIAGAKAGAGLAVDAIKDLTSGGPLKRANKAFQERNNARIDRAVDGAVKGKKPKR